MALPLHKAFINLLTLHSSILNNTPLVILPHNDSITRTNLVKLHLPKEAI